MSPELLIGYTVHWISVKNKNKNVSGIASVSATRPSSFVYTCVYTHIRLDMSHRIVYGCVCKLVIFYLQSEPQCIKYNSIFPFHYLGIWGYMFLLYILFVGPLTVMFSACISILCLGVHVCTCFGICDWYNYYFILSTSNFKRSLCVCKQPCGFIRKIHIFTYVQLTKKLFEYQS